MDTGSPECTVCFSQAIMSTLNGCTHKLCMDCAVRNSKYHKNNNRCALCPLCRGPYTIVTQIDNNLKYNISGKFKVPDFPWVSAFCMGLANNLRMRVTDEKIDMSMPEYLTEMIGCTSTVYWVVGENETMSEVLNGTMSKEMENRFVAIGKALTAWVLLPDIYPKLVAAKHLERMVKDGLIKKYPLPPYVKDTTVLDDSLSHGNTDDGGSEFTIAVVDLTTM
jgi:hypothetical protein